MSGKALAADRPVFERVVVSGKALAADRPVFERVVVSGKALAAGPVMQNWSDAPRIRG